MHEYIKNLQRNLKEKSNLETKNWFENYLKGSITYYGVKTPQVKIIVHNWREENKLENLCKEEHICQSIKNIKK